MPIIKHVKVNESSSWCLWHIEEDEKMLWQQLELPSIPSDFSTISNSTKKLEWMASRLSLKYLINLHGCSFGPIYKDDFGKPFFSTEHHISLAHSYPYAAAIFNYHLPTGIDLEKVQPKLIKVAHKYLNPHEIADVKEDATKACVYWTAKEALFKMHGRKRISFKEHLAIAPFHLQPSGIITANAMIDNKKLHHEIQYFKIEEYYLSICLA
jgi:4'-phosphopantetheinyl transferase